MLNDINYFQNYVILTFLLVLKLRTSYSYPNDDKTSGEKIWKAQSKAVRKVTGHHDVFIKFPTGKEGTIFIKSFRFIK